MPNYNGIPRDASRLFHVKQPDLEGQPFPATFHVKPRGVRCAVMPAFHVKQKSRAQWPGSFCMAEVQSCWRR